MSGSVPRLKLVERARDRYLTSGEIDRVVRPEIRDSWLRSGANGVPSAPDFELEADLDLDSRLVRASRPIFDRLTARLGGTGTSLFLADAGSVLLLRWADTPDLGRRLDRACSIPGAIIDERRVGTNGVGTVLKTGLPLAVTGPEHWADGYQSLACAGAPIRNRITGRVEGVLTVTCEHADNHPVVLPLVHEAACDIERELTIAASQRERELLDIFLLATRRTNRPVMAVSHGIVIATPGASRYVERIDQSLLWEHIAAAEISGAEGSLLIAEDDRVIDVRLRPHGVHGRGRRGVVIEFGERLLDARQAAPAGAPAGLPGCVGRSDAWQAAALAAGPALDRRRGLLVRGEPGAGKLALLRGALAARGLSAPVFDAALEPVDGTAAWVTAVREQLAAGTGFVVLRHVELLGDQAARALAAVVDAAAEPASPFLVTSCASPESLSPPVRALIRRIAATTVDVPPLRERRDDVRDLVVHVAAGRRRFSSGALDLLVRYDWPDNAREVGQVVERLCDADRRGDVLPDELPAALRLGSSKRLLSRLEEVELSALLRALAESGGNKSRAAELLGVSRSTVYRKLASMGEGAA